MHKLVFQRRSETGCLGLLERLVCLCVCDLHTLRFLRLTDYITVCQVVVTQHVQEPFQCRVGRGTH